MPAPSSNALGEIIGEQRELAKRSIRQFAEMAGISKPYLSQIDPSLGAPTERVPDAIAADRCLSARQATALREAYQAFVAASAHAQPKVGS